MLASWAPSDLGDTRPTFKLAVNTELCLRSCPAQMAARTPPMGRFEEDCHLRLGRGQPWPQSKMGAFLIRCFLTLL